MPKGVSSKKVFKHYNPEQDVLFPQSISALIPENHPVRLLSKVIDQLDLSNIYDSYQGGGASIYDPRMMLKIIVYAYHNNIYSCRAIERFITESTHAMWLSGGLFPDYRTINSFRGHKIKNEIDKIFTDITKLLIKEGLLSMETVFVDGTKMESVANRNRFVWKKTIEYNMGKIEINVNNILKEVNEIINKDDNTIDLPEEIKEISEKSIRDTVEELNSKLSESAKTADKSQLKQIKKAETRVRKLSGKVLDKFLDYQDSLEKLGDRNSYAKTDEEATFMRMKNDLLRPGYNIQLSTENQVIVNYSIHQTAGDTTTFIPHMESMKEKYGTTPNAVVADAAYGSMENWEYCKKNEMANYLKYNTFNIEGKDKYRLDISKSDNLYYNEAGDYYVCPIGQRMSKVGTATRTTTNHYQYEVSYYRAINCNGCPMRGACHKSIGNRQIEANQEMKKHKQTARENLTSERGRQLRKQRNYDVEPVFGDIKFNRRFNRLRMKGLEKANLEIGLLSVVHNLKKLNTALLQNSLFFARYLPFLLAVALIYYHNRKLSSFPSN